MRRLLCVLLPVLWACPVAVGGGEGLSEKPGAGVPEFTLLVYNVENLFDADDVAVFEDYRPGSYTRAHLATKLKNIASAVSSVNKGRGPDIILFQEVEGDQTAGDWDGDLNGFLERFGETSVQAMLAEGWKDDYKAYPAYAWLAKSLRDAGLGDYVFTTGKYRFSAQRVLAHHNVTATRFPVRSSQTLEVTGTRGILETVAEIGGQPVVFFNNHWKAGANDPEMEAARLADARVLRKRVDFWKSENPDIDLVIGGDLNSHYNQKALFPGLPETAVNDVLKSSGDLPAVLKGGDGRLYNLWFEVPVGKRGSDVYGGRWGTLMQIIVSRGLFDRAGIYYLPGSFFRVELPGENVHALTGAPRRWIPVGTGGGYSDHLPIGARFGISPPSTAASYVLPANVSSDPDGPPIQAEVDYRNISRKDLPVAGDFPAAKLRTVENVGTIFKVSGEVTEAWVTKEGKHRVAVQVNGESYAVFSHDSALLEIVGRKAEKGKKLSFVGELGKYRNRWQFLVQDASWL